ncbi:hypothetical protein ASU33_07185 [Solirubrum puertoriconensis]|uniref:Outer membrane protein beta-barrel domain-containing protein n=1 Tax=Solirubrum puertoriconensis TaxID=1751427 RepID=A0A9X0L4T3_SOLP1|nr:hypothetical protein ASU33_07185 [Solirubrum puertoriconensis]
MSAYHNGEGTATLRPAASLTAGYRIGQLRSWLSTELTYQVRNNLEQGTRPSLTVPVFLRTGLGGARFHVLIGGGFTRTLKRPPAPTQFREVKRQDTFVLLGLESDYLHQERRTAALGTYLYYGLTPAVNEYSYSPGGSRYSAQQLRHIGLNVTISPYWYR